MFFETPKFHDTLTSYATLNAKELFDVSICSNAKYNKKAALLTLFSKTDSDSVYYQWLLSKKHEDVLRKTNITFKNELKKNAYQAMQRPSSDLKHKLSTLAILKRIEHQTTPIIQMVTAKLTNTLIDIPLLLWSLITPYCSDDEIKILFMRLQSELQSYWWNDSGRERACKIIATIVPCLEPSQIPSTLLDDLQRQLQLRPCVKYEAGKAIARLQRKLESAKIPLTCFTELQEKLKNKPNLSSVNKIYAKKQDPDKAVLARLTHLQNQLKNDSLQIREMVCHDIYNLVSEHALDQIPQVLISDLENQFCSESASCVFHAANIMAASFPCLTTTQQLDVIQILLTKLQVLCIKLYVIEEIVSHHMSESLLPQLPELVRLTQHSLENDDSMISSPAWSILISLTLCFPSQVKTQFNYAQFKCHHWIIDFFNFLIELCEGQEFMFASNGSERCVKKLDCTEEEIKEMSVWANTFN